MSKDCCRRARSTRRRTPARTQYGRWVVIVSGLLVQMSATAAGSAPLTERAAIEQALSRPAYLQLEEGRVTVAESAVTAARLLPNPVLAMERERVGVGGGVTDSIRVFQTFDISGRRALRRDAATQRLEAARLEWQSSRLVTMTEVRRLFGEALYRGHLRTALAGWQQRIESAVQVVAQLARAGEASGYARRRLEREVQTAQARVSSTAADYARARQALGGLLGETAAGSDDVAGALLPDAPPPLESLQARLDQRPDLTALQRQADAYDHDRRIAERAWFPDLTVGAGEKRLDEAGRGDRGLIVAVSLPMPLFDRGQAGQQRAYARATEVRAERELVATKARAELRGLWQQTVQLRAAAETFRRVSVSSSRELTRIADAAYRGGEGTILELLDAYRAELEAQTTALELELRARLARIELDAVSGVKFHE